MSYPYGPPPQPQNSNRFLGMSAGILVLVIAGVIALFGIACVGLCAWSAATTPTDEPSSSWSAPRAVSCITCHG